eukprot:scaffold32528_cov171-Skeletonema_menzelii.AAC.5
MMSNNTFETMATATRTSEEEINFMVGDQDEELDMVLQEGGLQRAMVATLNRNGGDLQASIIDAALEEDFEDDMKFEGITFDQQLD